MQEVPSTQIKEKYIVFLARDLSWMLVGFLFLFCFYYAKDLPFFLLALASGVMGRGLNEVIHLFYKKPRPTAQALIPTPKNLSFPSGHTSFLLGVSAYIFLFFPFLGVIYFVLSLLVGFSRVLAGVHWWQDIVGSVPVGLVAACVVYYLSLGVN